MDEVEKRITKRNEIRKVNKRYEETAHEFYELSHYKKAMILAYQKSQEIHQQNEEKQ
ncbi:MULTISPECIES: hypothetical protein [Sporosarcina]|uniref:Uncharacterized protein n=1 Tax=Sporosarcina contaminans TaxID=633403 RepID=A0ABW3TWV8_9BACL